MRFKLPRGASNNVVFNTRLQVKTRVMSEPVWLRALEKNPPAPSMPRRQGWTRKALPQMKAPKDVLTDKVLRHAQSTREGRELMSAFGGRDNFAEKFTAMQMAQIRDGMSEPEAFRSAMGEMRDELKSHQEAVTKAYEEIVEARGGLSLSDFIETYAPAEEMSRWDADGGVEEVPLAGMEPEDMDLILDMAKVGVIDLELEDEGEFGEKLNYFWKRAKNQKRAYDDMIKEAGGVASADSGSSLTLEGVSEDELNGDEEVWSFDDSMLADVGGQTMYRVPPEIWSTDGATMPLLFTLDGDLVGMHDADTGLIMEVEVDA
eukprot:g4560.t1